MTDHPFPAISNPQITTTGVYSGDVIINLRELLTDIDLSPLFESWRPIIRTQFLFRSGKLAMSDSDLSNEVSIVVDDIVDEDGNFVLHIPAIGDDDTFLLAELPQIVSNKIITDSVLGSNLDAEGFNIIDIGTLISRGLEIRNPANTFSYIISPSAIVANRTITLPLLSANGNLVIDSFANVFTTTQKISSSATASLTSYNPTNTLGSGTGISFNLQNSTPTEISYAAIFAVLNEDNVGAELGSLAFYTRNGASFVDRMVLGSNNTLGIGITGNRVVIDPTGITTTSKNFTFPNLSGQVVTNNFANVFSAIQKIAVDNGIQMTFYRPVSTGGFGAGFYYNFNNASAAEVTYGNEYVSIESNVAGAHRGDFNIQLAVAAALGIRFRVFTSGDGGIIFGNNQRVLQSETGLTAQRTITYPDSNIKVLGEANSAPVTNKQLDTKTNTFMRIARVGAYSPASSAGQFTNDSWGTLKGIVGVGVENSVVVNTGGKYHQWQTPGTATNDCCGIVKLDSFVAQRLTNPLIRFAFRLDADAATTRMFKGWTAQRLLTLDSNTEPLISGEYGFLFGYGAGDSQFYIFHNDATGTCVKDPTGINLPGANTNYIVELEAVNSTPSFLWRLYAVDGTTQARSTLLGSGTITTDIPSSSSNLYMQDLMIKTTAVVQQNYIHYVEVY